MSGNSSATLPGFVSEMARDNLAFTIKYLYDDIRTTSIFIQKHMDQYTRLISQITALQFDKLDYDDQNTTLAIFRNQKRRFFPAVEKLASLLTEYEEVLSMADYYDEKTPTTKHMKTWWTEDSTRQKATELSDRKTTLGGSVSEMRTQLTKTITGFDQQRYGPAELQSGDHLPQ